MNFSRQIVLLFLVSASDCLIADFAKGAGSFSTVVIDPGHGGFDRGGIPGQLVPEKMVALDTALRLQKILERAGVRTVMTRTTDVFVPLPMRTAIANAQRDAIFVSIHYNASPRWRAHGIETYCEDSAGAPLAARIQRDILTQVSAENRGVKRAEYYVLRNCQIPAVLVECGFLSNRSEGAGARSASRRDDLADKIAEAIVDQRHGTGTYRAPSTAQDSAATSSEHGN